MDIREIERDDLKEWLDRGDDFRLVMTLGGWAFRASHIPGSEFYDTPESAFEALAEDETIVVYCSDPACVASQYAYQLLVRNGYSDVYRYSGGLSDWTEAGYPLEGDAVG